MTAPAEAIDPSRIWYATAAMAPPWDVRVMVRWQGGRPPFEAARVRDPRNHRRVRWLIHDAGRAVLLPTTVPPPDPRRPWAGWHTLSEDGPGHWRPLRPELWRLPLPPPAFVEPPESDGVLHTDRQSFNAVETALGVETTAAIEPAETDIDPQWWLNWWLVGTSSPGAVSEREAEGRLMRAFATERWITVERPRVALNCTVLARRAAERIGLDPDTEPPPYRGDEPTGRDRDDYLVAMAWLRGLDAGTVELLRLRSLTPPASWRRLAKAFSTDPGTVRARYRRTIRAVAAAANRGA